MSDVVFQAIAMSIYFVVMILIGVWGYRKTGDLDDYMIAGRNLGPLPTALSAGASDMSGWLLLGLPGALYLGGLVELWIAVGLTIGAWLNWTYVAPRLRSYTQVASDAITIPTFLGNRVHDKTNIIRVVSGVIILAFFTFYVSSGMVAGGVFFESAYGWNYQAGMLTVAAIVVLYTLMGGFLAVCYTDMVQGLMMVTALVMVPLIGIVRLGGFGATYDAIKQVDPTAFSIWGPTTTVFGVISLMAWGLGYFGQPHIIVRFMALKSPQEAKAGRRIGISWMILACIGAAATALVGIATFGRSEAELADPETVFIALGQLLFHPLIAGLLLAAILAAIMSTISSQLLVSSSALVEDIYLTFSKRTLSPKSSIMLGRLAVLLVAIVGAMLAWNQSDTILGLVAFAWAGFGAAFGPVILLSLYWKKLTNWGLFAGMVTGALTVAIWGNLEGGILDMYEILPGFILNTVVAVVVSLATYKPDAQITEEFDKSASMASHFNTKDESTAASAS